MTYTGQLVRGAKKPADLFGAAPLEEAAKLYKRLARELHPDAGGDADLFAKLNRLWGEFNNTGDISITTKNHVYSVGDRFERGDVANLYETTYDNGRYPCVLKLARSPRDNDLMLREARALRALSAGERKFRPFVPELLDSFRYSTDSTERRANVINRLNGFYTLRDVRGAYPMGVDPKDMTWMLKRLLITLGFAHQLGVIHGGVTPDHVMIHPEKHGLVLVDWTAACLKEDGIVPLISPDWQDMYPTEVSEKKKPGSGTDIFMAFKCMDYICGGRSKLPTAMRGFFNGVTLTKLAPRPNNAWALLEDYIVLVELLWGPRKFRPFAMPTLEGAK